jgi:hypothetical protein
MPAAMLRNVSCKALIHVTELFNHILMFGYFSTAWKSTKVIPIPKHGKSPPEPGSHKSISLLSTILIYIQQDATLHSLFYLETALHVSGDTTTHYQERKQLYLQHMVFVTPLLLPATILEELELV